MHLSRINISKEKQNETNCLSQFHRRDVMLIIQAIQIQDYRRWFCETKCPNRCDEDTHIRAHLHHIIIRKWLYRKSTNCAETKDAFENSRKHSTHP